MLDERGLERAIDAHYRRRGDRLFRMECRDRYEVGGGEEADFLRWLAPGEAEPDWGRKEGWLNILRAEEARGLESFRVRLFSGRMTDYERYEAEWCFVPNVQAGDAVAVLRAGEHTLPASLIREDYWLVNDTVLIPMHYDEAGRFLGADVVEDPSVLGPYVRARDDARREAEPFSVWWSRHPELHRELRARRE